MVVNIACFDSYGAEMFSCGIDGAIKPWYQHRGQINWEGTRWERKILTQQLKGRQENKKETSHNELDLWASEFLASDLQCYSGPFRTRKRLLWLQMQKGLPRHYNNTHFLMYYACLLSIILPENSKATKARSCGRPVLHVQSAQFNW